jgi:hypothetical protein
MEVKEKRREILVHGVPENIRKALVRDAKKQNLSINEVATALLAARFKVKRQPKQMPFTDGDGYDLTVRAGEAIHQKVAVEAAKRQGTLRGIVLETLALNYDISVPPVGRRPRKKREKTA